MALKISEDAKVQMPLAQLKALNPYQIAYQQYLYPKEMNLLIQE